QAVAVRPQDRGIPAVTARGRAAGGRARSAHIDARVGDLAPLRRGPARPRDLLLPPPRSAAPARGPAAAPPARRAARRRPAPAARVVRRLLLGRGGLHPGAAAADG